MDVLFGELVYRVKCSESGFQLEHEPVRLPNGIWMGKSRLVNTQVSAVLFTIRLTPWNIPRTKIRLYHNPWARNPYSSVLTCLPQAIPQNNKIEEKNGKSLSEIFDLSFNWPEDDP